MKQSSGRSSNSGNWSINQFWNSSSERDGGFSRFPIGFGEGGGESSKIIVEGAGKGEVLGGSEMNTSSGDEDRWESEGKAGESWKKGRGLVRIQREIREYLGEEEKDCAGVLG